MYEYKINQTSENRPMQLNHTKMTDYSDHCILLTRVQHVKSQSTFALSQYAGIYHMAGHPVTCVCLLYEISYVGTGTADESTLFY
jgi:flavin reductase (DIM6/NTAB) family NADH-FMN oxidoreductase RutF